MATKKRTAIIIILLLWYLYLLNFSQYLSEDVNAGNYQVMFILFILKFIYAYVENHVYLYLYSVFQKIFIFGWLRVLLYFIVISVVAYLSVTVVLDQSLNIALDYGKEVFSRLEGNILELHEERTAFETRTVHPITKGVSEPQYFQQVFRYPMEDVKITCSVREKWFSRSLPSRDQIIWRKDGVDLSLSERHRHHFEFKEDLESDIILREKGLSWYDLKSTLIISLLQDEDFGTYTCHSAKFVTIAVRDYLEMSEKLFGTKSRVETSPPTRPGRTPGHCPVPKPRPQCTQLPVPAPQFQDVYTWFAEIRLIRMNARQEIISVPPGAILSFKSTYWHLSRHEDIEIDYTVNGQSSYQLCGGFLNGCSKFLVLYWKMTHSLSFFAIPPFQLFWRSPDFPANQCQHVHCVCENAYGYHKVQYIRHYFDPKKQKYEVVEITHPHQLIVIPRKQDMLDVYTNTSSSGPIFRQPTVPLETLCSWKLCEELESIRQVASVAAELFWWKEWVWLFAVILLLSFFFSLVLSALFWTARFAKRHILEGGIDKLTNPRNAVQNAREFEYDVFLSYSDADDVRVTEMISSFLEAHGFRTFSRGRNVLEGMQELSATDAAMEKSERFLIIATGNYFSDEYSGGFEAGVLLECIFSAGRDPGQVLVVKLDQCEIPQRLRQFTAHDWTLGLDLTLYQRKLLQWMVSPAFGRTCRLWATATKLLFILIVAASSLLMVGGSRLFFSG